MAKGKFKLVPRSDASKAFRQGYRDATLSITKDDNPYDYSMWEDAHNEWLAGWCLGFTEKDQEVGT